MTIPKASTISMIQEMRRLREQERAAAGGEPPPPMEVVRSCNRHDDCDRADRENLARRGVPAEHCNDETCEDCFGS